MKFKFTNDFMKWSTGDIVDIKCFDDGHADIDNTEIVYINELFENGYLINE